LNVGGPQIQKDIDLRVGGPDVVVDDCRMGQVERFLLVGFASDDVVAHELILGALELAPVTPSVFSDSNCASMSRSTAASDWPGHDGDRVEEVRILKEVRAAERGDRDPLVVHEVVRHPRALASKRIFESGESGYESGWPSYVT